MGHSDRLRSVAATPAASRQAGRIFFIQSKMSSGGVTVVGSCNFDQVVFVPAMPLPGQTVYGTKYVTGFGGKGANQVILYRIIHISEVIFTISMAGCHVIVDGLIGVYGI